MATVCFAKAKNSPAADFMIGENRARNVEREETPRREGHKI